MKPRARHVGRMGLGAAAVAASAFERCVAFARRAAHTISSMTDGPYYTPILNL